MFCSRTLLLLAGVLGVVSGGCARREPRPVERLAVLPLENLSDDASVDWSGWALAEMAATQANGSGDLHVTRVAGERELPASNANTVVRGYVTVRGERIRAHAVRQTISARRVESTFDSVEAFPDGIVRLGNRLASWIQPTVTPFDTDNVEALQALAEGREAESDAAAISAYQRAIDLDPNFGAPYVAWTQALLLKRDQAGAMRVLAMAKAKGNRIGAPRIAELNLLESAVTGDGNLRRGALLALSKATPADADVFRRLAEEDYAARRYDTAAGFYRQAAQLNPTNVASWNQLGYTEALRGNLEAARSALREYARLDPKGANPSDSMGDVHYYLGAFREAEKNYLEAFEKDPRFLNGSELYKAARARLMTGDVSGADEIFRRYVATLTARQDPLAEYCRGQWLYLSGRKPDGVAQMTRAAASAKIPAAQVMAESQLAIWNLESGDRQQAAAWVQRAAAAPPSPLSSRLVALCKALLAPPERGLPDSETSSIQLNAISLLLNRRFAEAVPGLKLLVEKSSPTGSDGAPVLLAWALVETGRFRDAMPLLETYGTPPPGVEEPLTCLSFPRMLQLRALVFEKLGRSQDAAESREIFRKLSGDQTRGGP